MRATARAQAAGAKGSALALLAAEYAGRLGLLQQAGGDDLAVKIEALKLEQHHAEQALSLRLAAEESGRQLMMCGTSKPPTRRHAPPEPQRPAEPPHAAQAIARATR